MKNRSKLVYLAVCVVLLASLACNMSAGSDVSTSATQNAAALTAQAANPGNPNNSPGLVPASPVPPTSAGVAPPPTLSPTVPVTQQAAAPTTAVPTTAVPTTAVPIPCDRASFVKDMNFPDGTKVKAGEVIEKTWKLKNNGSCSWTSGYAVVFDHGDQMGATKDINFTAAPIKPGVSIDVSVMLTAPTKPGTYQGFFMLKNEAGKKFGINEKGDTAFWVKIVVEAVSAPPASNPGVYKTGLLEIPQTWTIDLDSGQVGPPSGKDIHYEVDINSSHNLVFLGPAKQFAKQPTYDDCKNAQMDSPSVPINTMSLGTYFCYLTDAGRLGYLEYAGVDTTPGAGKLYLEFTTWKK